MKILSTFCGRKSSVSVGNTNSCVDVVEGESAPCQAQLSRWLSPKLETVVTVSIREYCVYARIHRCVIIMTPFI